MSSPQRMLRQVYLYDVANFVSALLCDLERIPAERDTSSGGEIMSNQ